MWNASYFARTTRARDGDVAAASPSHLAPARVSFRNEWPERPIHFSRRNAIGPKSERDAWKWKRAVLVPRTSDASNVAQKAIGPALMAAHFLCCVICTRARGSDAASRILPARWRLIVVGDVRAQRSSRSKTRFEISAVRTRERRQPAAETEKERKRSPA